MSARKALAAIAVAALASSTAVRAATVSEDESRSPALVSLGDSFISGEGAGGGYGGSGVNGCHRSRSAPIRSAPISGAKRVNLACSGARTVNVLRAVAGGRSHRGEPPQADRLAAVARRYDVRLVVLTVGANDLGFARLVARCALRWAVGPLAGSRGCRRGAAERLAAALPAVERDLGEAIREVRRAMAAAGEPRRRYRLSVMGYASPIPAGAEIRFPERSWARLTRGGCPLTDEDADWAKLEAVPAIVQTMRAAARVAGAEFLDVSPALDGHEACSRGAVPTSDEDTGGDLVPASRAEWFRGLDLCCERRPRESLHPNRHGQRALGACIALAYEAPPGNHVCHNTPGRGYAGGMHLTLLD